MIFSFQPPVFSNQVSAVKKDSKKDAEALSMSTPHSHLQESTDGTTRSLSNLSGTSLNNPMPNSPPNLLPNRLPLLNSSTQPTGNALANASSHVEQQKRYQIQQFLSDKLVFQFQEFQKMISSQSSEAVHLNRTLHAHQQSIRDTLAKIASETQLLLKNNQELVQNLAILEKELNALKCMEDVNLDSLVQPIVHQQLFDAVADSHAIEDTLYHYIQFYHGHIELSTFIKVRNHLFN